MNFWIFGHKFAQKWILGSISTSNIPCVPIFIQNGQLLIFRPKFGEIVQLRAIFWFKYCWGCCRELGGDWNELDGGGWRWVEVGAWFSNNPFYYGICSICRRCVWVVFLGVVLWYVVPVLFSCSTIPWYSCWSARIRLCVPPVFRCSGVPCSVVPCSGVPGFIVSRGWWVGGRWDGDQ